MFVRNLLRFVGIIVIMIATWFGVGGWMCDQPSDWMYFGGMAVNVLAVIPMFYMIRAIYRDIDEGVQ